LPLAGYATLIAEKSPLHDLIRTRKANLKRCLASVQHAENIAICAV
jgi:hypothetical protein